MTALVTALGLLLSLEGTCPAELPPAVRAAEVAQRHFGAELQPVDAWDLARGGRVFVYATPGPPLTGWALRRALDDERGGHDILARLRWVRVQPCAQRVRVGSRLPSHLRPPVSTTGALPPGDATHTCASLSP